MWSASFEEAPDCNVEVAFCWSLCFLGNFSLRPNQNFVKRKRGVSTAHCMEGPSGTEAVRQKTTLHRAKIPCFASEFAERDTDQSLDMGSSPLICCMVPLCDVCKGDAGADLKKITFLCLWGAQIMHLPVLLIMNEHRLR